MASLNFKGKSAVWNHHLSVPYHTLEQDIKLSLKGENDNENLIIAGDNLLALKSLLPQYQGRVKCIFIDPPYNTGKENWVYSDNVSSPIIRSWVDSVVGSEGEDLTRHDKWLAMITPRLKLLRELLQDDGTIFVAIDDNEVHRLRSLLDEIFGAENFVASVIWQHSLQPKGYTDKFSVHHNYILAYNKTSSSVLLPLERTDEHNKNYSNPDNDPKGEWRSGDVRNALYRPNLIYDIKTPSGKIIKSPANGWRWSKTTIAEKIKSGEIVFSKDETRIIRKIYLKDVQGRAPETIWFGKDVGTTRDATAEIKDLFGSAVFETPKPTGLIKRILEIATEPGDIILDSFAGSGTTAHAVMEMNKDGGDRKFILVQLPEKIGKGTAAYKEGYREVCELTRDRVALVAKKYKLKDGFTFAKLGPAIDAETILSGKLPTYKEFAKYVYYLATGKNHPAESKIKETDYFVGASDHESIYLIYEKDLEQLKKLAITLDWAQKAHKKDAGKKIVYSPACFLDDEALDQYNIKFVSIPYNLFERTV